MNFSHGLVQYLSGFSLTMQILSGQEEYSSRNQLRKVKIETFNQNIRVFIHF